MSPVKTVVGQAETKVDGKKLVQGKPVFTGDIHMEGMLYGALLTSPHAYANIRNIDASKARALPGVHAVLTYKDIPRIKYATGGQSYPQPLPYDQVSLDNVVRHVGDRVAVVAAETIEIAEQALRLIEVDYEVLPAIIDPEEALKPGAPMVHAENDTEGIFDAKRNVVYHIEADYGDVEKGFKEAERVFEGEYHTPKQQQVHLEPHVCVSYLDEDDRLVLRTSTQVPFHIRRMVAPLVGLPVKKIRVINDPEIKALESLVEVEMLDGKSFSSFSDILQQIPTLEVKKERVASKFLDLCGPVLGKRKSIALINRIEALDTLQDMGDMAESLL